MSILRICRRLSCLEIALGATFVCRWVPSEWNVADAGSRKWKHLRVQDAAGDFSIPSQSGRTQPAVTLVNQASTEMPFLLPATCAELPSRTSHSMATTKAGKAAKRKAMMEQTPSVPRFRASGNLSPSSSGLRREGSTVSSLCQTAEDEPQEQDQVRQCLLRVSQSYVRNRMRLRRRDKNMGCSPGCLPRLFPEASSIAEGVARMEQVGPRTNKASSSLAFDSIAGDSNVEKGSLPVSVGSHADVCGIPETRRGTQRKGRRLGRSLCRASMSLSKSASRGKERVIQSGAYQRDHPLGQCHDPVFGKAFGGHQAPAGFRFPPGLELPPVAESMAGCSQASGPPHKSRSSLSTLALRPLSRSTAASSESSRDKEARAMGERQIGEEIRGPCQSQPAISSPTQSASATESAGKQGLRNGGPKTFLATRGKTSKWVIELFSGTARLSQAMAMHGFNVIAYDVEYGCHCELLSKKVLKSLWRFIKTHDVVLVWMGMPCQSWSRARKWDGGLPPLRDDDRHLMGRPHLSSTDAVKVELGNRLLATTYKISRLLMALQVPWVIENPWTS